MASSRKVCRSFFPLIILRLLAAPVLTVNSSRGQREGKRRRPEDLWRDSSRNHHFKVNQHFMSPYGFLFIISRISVVCSLCCDSVITFSVSQSSNLAQDQSSRLPCVFSKGAQQPERKEAESDTWIYWTEGVCIFLCFASMCFITLLHCDSA